MVMKQDIDHYKAFMRHLYDKCTPTEVYVCMTMLKFSNKLIFTGHTQAQQKSISFSPLQCIYQQVLPCQFVVIAVVLEL